MIILVRGDGLPAPYQNATALDSLDQLQGYWNWRPIFSRGKKIQVAIHGFDVFPRRKEATDWMVKHFHQKSKHVTVLIVLGAYCPEQYILTKLGAQLIWGKKRQRGYFRTFQNKNETRTLMGVFCNRRKTMEDADTLSVLDTMNPYEGKRILETLTNLVPCKTTKIALPPRGHWDRMEYHRRVLLRSGMGSNSLDFYDVIRADPDFQLTDAVAGQNMRTAFHGGTLGT